jgi:hypothetical protein
LSKKKTHPMKRNILFSKVGTGFVDRVLNVENDKQITD